MKIPTLILCLCFCFIACNDSRKDSNAKDISRKEVSIETASETDHSEKPENKNADPEKNDSDTSEDISGIYFKSDQQQDTACKCSCVDINFNSTSQLCLIEDKLYIQGRFEQSGNNINLYYSEVISNNTDAKIPWDKVDTGTPIAVLTPEGKELKLDWKGFSFDGKIAIDYALLGKKTLEGTYKKQ